MKTKSSLLLPLFAVLCIFALPPLLLQGQMAKPGTGVKAVKDVTKTVTVLPGAVSTIVDLSGVPANAANANPAGTKLIARGRGVLTQIRVQGVGTNNLVPLVASFGVQFWDVNSPININSGVTNKQVICPAIVLSNQLYTIDYPNGVQFENGLSLQWSTNSAIGPTIGVKVLQ